MTCCRRRAANTRFTVGQRVLVSTAPLHMRRMRQIVVALALRASRKIAANSPPPDGSPEQRLARQTFIRMADIFLSNQPYRESYAPSAP